MPASFNNSFADLDAIPFAVLLSRVQNIIYTYEHPTL